MAWTCCAAVPAVAHPLGNFTINHLTELQFLPGRARVRYVLDLAEIPTFQAMRAVSPDGKMSPEQLTAWAGAQARTLLPELHLTDGGRPVSLALEGVTIRTHPGAGGLPLIYMTMTAQGRLPQGSSARALSYEDATFPGRLGWHDVVVAPATEPTHELLAYPSALLGSPRSTTAVTVTFASGGRAIVQATPSLEAGAASTPAASAIRSNQLSDMLARGTGDLGFVLLTLVVAVGLGALHALEPGHGKTLLAISLVGARATVKQATILAAALTIAHTVGVLALGVAINLFKGYFVPESIYPWITLISGIAIAVIGARAVQAQIRRRQPHAHSHDHSHDHAHAHAHDHDHGHDHVHVHDHEHVHNELAHARAHAIPGDAPLTFGGTVWAAMSGGIAPCPAALVVLLAAIALDQVAYGILVIVAFSIGLALTLTGLGIAVVRGAGWLHGRPQFERFVRYGPLASAIVIAAIGAVMVGQGFAAQGISAPPVLVSAITALAIAGYAFSYPFAPRRAEAT